jgi:hypothetical protein
MELLTQRGAIREEGETGQTASSAQVVSKANPNAIIKVEKEKEGLVPPAFAALGDMYEILGLIWSGVAPNTMSQYDAEKFCQGLGEEVRLPTKEEWEVLSKIMSPGGIFNPDLFPETKGKGFWSSSVPPLNSDLAFRFFGVVGHVNYSSRNYNYSVRCVLPAVAW